MADQIEIPNGNGGVVNVPAWATEETAKEMMKYNEASAKALTVIAAQHKKSSKVVEENKKIFKELRDATQRDTQEAEQAEKKLTKLKQKHGKALDRTNKSMEKTSKIMDGMASGSLKEFAVAIAGIAGLGAIAGAVVGGLENFAKNVSELSNVGVGLGTSLTDLRNQAALTGTDIEAYGKLVMSNGDALRSLGSNAQDGARIFSNLSRETRLAARTFNQFGMSNTEFNEVLLQEVELRRKSGMDQAAIYDSVAASMNNLMTETTALAAMTGQDRRELLRARSEALNTDAATAFRMSLAKEGKEMAENFGMIASVFSAGGEVGEKIGQAMSDSIATGMDFRAVNNSAVAGIASINADVNRQLQEIFEFADNNYRTMDTGDFTAELQSKLAELGESLPADALRQLGIQAAGAGNENASAMISLISELQGLETEVNLNKEAQAAAREGLQNTDVLALASTLEELTTRIKDSALDTAIGAFTDDLDAGAEALVASLRKVSDFFGPGTTLESGIVDSYMELTTAGEKLTHAAGLLIAASIAMRMGRGLGLGLGRGGRGTRPSTGGTRPPPAAGGGAPAAGAASWITKLGKYIKWGGAGAAAATVALTPTMLGDGTASGQWETDNPFPENGTEQEQLEWQRRREAAMMAGPTTTQADIDAADARRAADAATRERNALYPPFEERDQFEQADLRMQTPRGELDQRRATGGLDAETHAILTGRTFPRMLELMERQLDEITRARRIAEDSQ